MIEKKLSAGAVEVRDGWAVTADPMGGSQFDAGVCGVALLQAGAAYGEADWLDAGYRAVDWALNQACVTNFNYKAFSFRFLLKPAGRPAKQNIWRRLSPNSGSGWHPDKLPMDDGSTLTMRERCITSSSSRRWDLLDALPKNRSEEIPGVKEILRPAVAALLAEFATMGITVECLVELRSVFNHLGGEDLQLPLDRVAASLVEKCSDGVRVKAAAQPHQLAAVVA